MTDTDDAALDLVHREEEWMAEHGGNLAGYVARYGSAADPDHYGDGGEEIYAADRLALAQAEAEVKGTEVLHYHCPAMGCYWRIQFVPSCSRCGGATVQPDNCCTLRRR